MIHESKLNWPVFLWAYRYYQRIPVASSPRELMNKHILVSFVIDGTCVTLFSTCPQQTTKVKVISKYFTLKQLLFNGDIPIVHCLIAYFYTPRTIFWRNFEKEMTRTVWNWHTNFYKIKRMIIMVYDDFMYAEKL